MQTDTPIPIFIAGQPGALVSEVAVRVEYGLLFASEVSTAIEHLGARVELRP